MFKFLFPRRKQSKKQINKIINKFFPDIDEIVAAGKIEILRYMNNTIDETAAKQIFAHAFFRYNMMEIADEEKLKKGLDIAFPELFNEQQHKHIFCYLGSLRWARALGQQLVPTDNPDLYYFMAKKKSDLGLYNS